MDQTTLTTDTLVYTAQPAMNKYQHEATQVLSNAKYFNKYNDIWTQGTSIIRFINQKTKSNS